MKLQSFDLTPDGPVDLCFVAENGLAHRSVRCPGDDLSDLPAEARLAIMAHWSPERVAAFQASQVAVEAEVQAMLPPIGVLINEERQRRIETGKVINGVHVTGRDEDARNLTNLALAAQMRIAGGDTTTLTTYRDGNNVDHALTPPQMLALWQQSSAYVSDLYAASWAIKAMDPMPDDVTADELWPAKD